MKDNRFISRVVLHLLRPARVSRGTGLRLVTPIRVRLITGVLWLAIATLLLPPALRANGEARLYMQAIPLQDEKLLVVDVLLADVTDLFGAELQLHYDPTQLEVQDANPRLEGVQITPGPFLASEDRFVVANHVDTQAGLINFAATLLSPAPPISGEGVLATVAFETIGAGPFAVQVVNVQLVSSSMDSLPVTTEDWHIDAVGQGEPAQTPASGRIPPLLLWGVVVLLCALLALVFLVLPRLKQAAAVTPSVPTASHRRMPGASLTSSRSSALLTQQGNHAMVQGDVQKAYELLSQAVELDPANAEAWLGKGLMAQHETEKRICFQRVLALDPDNTRARAELQQLE